jgi:hypothetical protein
VIRQPLGNALLLGVGGSGRKSLARLAAFIEDYEVGRGGCQETLPAFVFSLYMVYDVAEMNC